MCDIDMDQVFGTLMGAKARYLLFETSNPRHAHEWTVFRDRAREIPMTRYWCQGGRHNHELCRTPGPGCGADRPVRRHRPGPTA